MIRHQAFIEKRKMLKGNLHTHTTRSDGKLTPEEVMRLYKDKGYDFIALTDHHIYNLKNFDEGLGLTIIPGVETDTHNLMPSGRGYSNFHVVAIGPSKENGNGYEQDEDITYINVKNSKEYQPYLDDMHKRNNLTIYCHPEWSSTPARMFDTQKGHTAMEIWNTTSVVNYDIDKDASYWDELLAQDIKIWGVASDDSHSEHTLGRGFVMVNAENDINSILEALKEGKFYSSTGPLIYDFYIENDKAIIECSPAVRGALNSMGHQQYLQRPGKEVTRFEFDLNRWPKGYSYIRLDITDKDGNKAWTNPIFLID